MASTAQHWSAGGHRPSLRGLIATLNGPWHRQALLIFMAIVLAHWTEHLAQAFQIWVLHWTRPESRGVLGLAFPWLVKSEWLHYTYAVLMLAGLVLLRPGFVGRARMWWDAAIIIQFWHHFEHALLLFQVAVLHHPLFGSAVPTSIAQLAFPRVELHLFYNAIVTIPMLIAMLYHRRPSTEDARQMVCSCAVRGQLVAAAV